MSATAWKGGGSGTPRHAHAGDSHPLLREQPTPNQQQQSDELISYADFERLIKEKERDLELAAKIGKSLLDQNRELQERNEFLEESLAASNDSVVQLKYQLQQRSALLNAFAEYDEQVQFGDASTSEFHSGFIENLENRVKQLENENSQLKNEIMQLRDTSEDRQNARVRDYLTQLEKANFKIGQLQLQIADKNGECNKQSEEIQRLMKEIARRKEREKAAAQENADLQAELSAAVRNHEELRTEIEALQEKYCDIVAILNETQEELRTVRLENAQKTSSLNSLYDSLASELEASDSGFYSTPMTSARNDATKLRSLEAQQSQQLAPASALRLELERLDRESSPIDEVLSASVKVDDSPPPSAFAIDVGTPTQQRHANTPTSTAFYDMPSRVIMDAVKRTMSAEERRRARSASHTPQISLDDSADVSNRVARRSPRCSSVQATTSTASAKSPRPLETFHEERTSSKNDESEQQAAKIDSKDKIGVESSAQTSHPPQQTKSFRDSSCSPIRVLGAASAPVETHPDEPTPRAAAAATRTASSVFFPYSGATSYMPNSSTEDAATTSHALSTSSSCPSSSASSCDEEETPRSADSLAHYPGPRLGQPGSPGSRDLEFSLRKMQLHKKLSEDYEQYRKNRGLEPAQRPIYSGRSSAKHEPDGGTELASVAAGFGAVAPADERSSAAARHKAGASGHGDSASRRRHHHKHRENAKGRRNRLDHASVRLGNAATATTSNSHTPATQQKPVIADRPRSLLLQRSSTSIGLQLWEHQQRCQQKHQRTERGIDSAIRDRMPLVCGVLWRSVAPRTQSIESSIPSSKKEGNIRRPEHNESTAKSELQKRAAQLPVASGSQLFDSLGLSPIRHHSRVEPTPLERLNRLLRLDGENTVKKRVAGVPRSASGLDSVLVPPVSPLPEENNAIVERSLLLPGRPNL